MGVPHPRPLSDRACDVLKHRYGLFGVKTMTLKELAGKHNVSLERIRGIERQSIRRILKKHFPDV